MPYAASDPVPPAPDAYAAVVARALGDLKLPLVFEMGRMIAGNAGILLSSVIYLKHGEGRDFLILDAAMNDLIRPAMYGAYHHITVLPGADAVSPAAAPPPAADQDPAPVGVAEGIGEEVLQDPPQQRGIGPNRHRGRHPVEAQAVAGRQRREFRPERPEHVRQPEVGEDRRRHPAVELRHLQQLAEKMLDRIERGVDLRYRRIAAALGQRAARRPPPGSASAPKPAGWLFTA